MGINPYERELSQAQACCFLKTVQLNSNVHDFRLDGPGWWWWTLSWRWDVAMWNIYSISRERDRCEIWWYFWFMFSGQTQIHLPNMAYFHIYLGYVSNLSRLQIDSRFTTIRLITNPMNIFKFTFFTVTEFNICTTVLSTFFI